MDLLDDALLYSDWYSLSGYGGKTKSLFMAWPHSGSYTHNYSCSRNHRWSGWGGLGCSRIGDA
jgi:hypothetical protein